MKGIIVSLYAITASFRDPNTHLYQETIFAPPPTTLLGIAGAALGMGFEDALEYFKRNKISVGCILKSEGFGKDLWNYSKLKGGKVGKDILIREFLYGVDIDIFITCETEEVIEDMSEAFKNPHFALTLGNSDELVKILNIEICDNVSMGKSKNIKNSWICGNYINEFELDWKKVEASPIKLTIKPPVIKNLPIDFEFNDNQERIATAFNEFTFLGEFHLLKEPVVVYLFGDKRVPLFTFSYNEN